MSPRFQGENLDANLALVNSLRKIADDVGATPAQVAIAWVAAQGNDIVPLVGARRRDRLSEALGALDVKLTPGHLAELAKAFPPDHRAVHGSGSEQYERKMQANPPVLHPVVRTHPETGEDSLFVNEGFTTAIQGLAKKESDDLLAFLFAHVHKPEFSVRWRWKPNTLAMWDNRSTQHYAVNDYLPHRRVMHRATLKGSRPFNRSRPNEAN